MVRLERTRRSLMREAIGRGVDRGEFPPVDAKSCIEASLGAVYLRFLVIQRPVDRRYVASVVRVVLWGAGVRAVPM